MRNILHCDMNNFYASVECMLYPTLKKYPIAVCGSVEERHGIVLAKNYKAKAFDVKTGDAVWQAKQKCKDLVVVPPHYEEYIKYSKLARSVYERYTDQVEPYGMDTNADAKKRKTQIEFEQQSGTFIIPNATTVADLLEEYCSVYGVNNWAMSTYRSKKGLMYAKFGYAHHQRTCGG